ERPAADAGLSQAAKEKCHICSASFETMLEMLSHQVNEHTGTMCPIISCNKIYKKSGKRLSDHLKMHVEKTEKERMSAGAAREASKTPSQIKDKEWAKSAKRSQSVIGRVKKDWFGKRSMSVKSSVKAKKVRFQ
ncbi:hypothetical protein PENTCL1PPCAC_26049, partial [Pristionchus entomophagus]